MVSAGYKGAKVSSSGKDIIMILAVVAGLIVVFYYLAKREVGNLASGAINAITSIPSQITGAIQAIELSQEQVIAQAAGRTAEEYNQYLTNMSAIPEAMVYAGNVITPSFVLESAATAGTEFRADLEASGDYDRYQNLDPVSKSLVTTGEAIMRTFTGWSPYEAGQSFSSWWNS